MAVRPKADAHGLIKKGKAGEEVDLEIDNRDPDLALTEERKKLLESALLAGISYEKAPEDIELSLSFVTGDEIRLLNRNYRGVDQETDVLSFPLYEKEEVWKKIQNKESFPAGDIVLNQDRIREQALEFGHSEDREAAYLAVHSFLHLLGYDHMEKEDKKEMRAHEEAILREIGLSQEDLGLEKDPLFPESAPFKSGFCAVIGRSNVGKSTFLNGMMEQKLSIISNKPQTTRNDILLIYSDSRMQVIFTDTPGIQIPKNELGKAMIKMSRKALQGVDLCIYMTDLERGPGKMDLQILEKLKEHKEIPMIALLNKEDLASPENLQETLSFYELLGLFQKVICLSAIKEEKREEVKEAIYELLPEGPMYYPEEMVTDRPVRFMISEIIREKCLKNLQKEVPHGVAVEIRAMSYREGDTMADIDAEIIVEKQSHKGIVIGKEGKKLKVIGIQARKEIEKLIDCPVNLRLFVKVRENWRKDKKKVKQFGYDESS